MKLADPDPMEQSLPFITITPEPEPEDWCLWMHFEPTESQRRATFRDLLAIILQLSEEQQNAIVRTLRGEPLE